MKTIPRILFFFLISGIWISFAQESLMNQALVSPEVAEDGRVTFRLKAPDVREVKLTGDWMPPEGFGRASVSMGKGADSVWTFTTEPLPSELY